MSKEPGVSFFKLRRRNDYNPGTFFRIFLTSHAPNKEIKDAPEVFFPLIALLENGQVAVQSPCVESGLEPVVVLIHCLFKVFLHVIFRGNPKPVGLVIKEIKAAIIFKNQVNIALYDALF